VHVGLPDPRGWVPASPHQAFGQDLGPTKSRCKLEQEAADPRCCLPSSHQSWVEPSRRRSKAQSFLGRALHLDELSLAGFITSFNDVGFLGLACPREYHKSQSTSPFHGLPVETDRGPRRASAAQPQRSDSAPAVHPRFKEVVHRDARRRLIARCACPASAWNPRLAVDPRVLPLSRVHLPSPTDAAQRAPDQALESRPAGPFRYIRRRVTRCCASRWRKGSIEFLLSRPVRQPLPLPPA